MSRVTWKRTRLRFVASLNPPISSSTRSDLTSERAFLPMEAIGENWQLDGSRSKVVGESLQGYSYFQDGDLLIAKVTPCFENGKAAVVQELRTQDGFATTEVTVIRPSRDVDRRFLFYRLRAADFMALGRSEMTGAGGLRRVPDNVFRNFTFEVPARTTQVEIANYLDRETAEIDAFIADQDELIALLEERRQAAALHLILGRNIIEPRQSVPADWIQSLPSSWTAVPAKSIAKFKAGGTPESTDERYWGGSEGVPWISIGDMEAAQAGEPTGRTITRAGLQIARLSPSTGPTVLFAMYASVGEVSLQQESSVWNQAILGLQPRAVMDVNYLYWAMRLMKPTLARYFRSNTQDNLNAEQVGNLIVPLPPIDVQRQQVELVAEATSVLDASLADAREATALLKERRAALISAAVAGQIDVTGKKRVLI